MNTILKSGKNIELPLLINYITVKGYDKDHKFHWFDFTKEEREELANAIKDQYLLRKEV